MSASCGERGAEVADRVAGDRRPEEDPLRVDALVGACRWSAPSRRRPCGRGAGSCDRLPNSGLVVVDAAPGSELGPSTSASMIVFHESSGTGQLGDHRRRR